MATLRYDGIKLKHIRGVEVVVHSKSNTFCFICNDRLGKYRILNMRAPSNSCRLVCKLKSTGGEVGQVEVNGDCQVFGFVGRARGGRSLSVNGSVTCDCFENVKKDALVNIKRWKLKSGKKSKVLGSKKLTNKVVHIDGSLDKLKITGCGISTVTQVFSDVRDVECSGVLEIQGAVQYVESDGEIRILKGSSLT